MYGVYLYKFTFHYAKIKTYHQNVRQFHQSYLHSTMQRLKLEWHLNRQHQQTHLHSTMQRLKLLKNGNVLQK